MYILRISSMLLLFGYSLYPCLSVTTNTTQARTVAYRPLLTTNSQAHLRYTGQKRNKKAPASRFVALVWICV